MLEMGLETQCGQMVREVVAALPTESPPLRQENNTQKKRKRASHSLKIAHDLDRSASAP